MPAGLFPRARGTFAAITDPGSELEELARERSFAWVVAGEPTIGGRYSALSPFGMVPAALMDLDVRMILERADAMAQWCRLGEENPGFAFGLQLGEGWSEGRDKVCIDETPGGFGLWAEQLIAESTGKEGKGLVPAPGEDPDGPDRQHGRVRLDDPYDLGAEFFRWEFANRGRRLDPRHQSLRPARRPGGEGPDGGNPPAGQGGRSGSGELDRRAARRR